MTKFTQIRTTFSFYSRGTLLCQFILERPFTIFFVCNLYPISKELAKKDTKPCNFYLTSLLPHVHLFLFYGMHAE